MKRTVVLVLLLLVVVASISGTNAAFSRQVALPSDIIELATPTPTTTPVPTVTPMPTPTPQPWTGEFEIIVNFQGNIWRSTNPERLLGNIRFEFYNYTDKATMVPVDVSKWELTFKANLDMSNAYNVQLSKLASNRYRLTSVDGRSIVAGKSDKQIGAGVSSYDLTRLENNVKLRTTNPSLLQLIFSESNLRIETISNSGEFITLAPHRFKVTFEAPKNMDNYTSRWEDGVVYPPGWVLVH